MHVFIKELAISRLEHMSELHFKTSWHDGIYASPVVVFGCLTVGTVILHVESSL